MNGIRGKMCTQAGHAYLHSYWDGAHRFPESANAYFGTDHAYKITLIVDTVADLEVLYNTYKDKCGVSLIKDAGFTVFTEPTVTCLGIGPIFENDVGEDLKSLKTFT